MAVHSGKDDGAGHGHDAGHDGHDDAHHHHHDHHHEALGARRLGLALAVLGGFTVIEAAGGLWANSIALLAEAVHMLADCGSLLLAIIAIRVSQRPARPDRTYGHRRYQPLAAYTNGLMLLAMTGGVMVEAARRLLAAPAVDGRVMLVVALIGGVANFVAFLLLSGGHSLNERGARAHVLSDLMGSGAAVLAAAIVLLFHWLPADPLLSLALSVLILRSGWQVTRDAAHVLLEGAPVGFDAGRVEKELTGLPGVAGVHHVHAWSLTGESPIVTLHADLAEGADRQAALAQVLDRLHDRFGIEHATVQFEEGHCAAPVPADGCHDPG
jgi:cobalt-zinc-cadmium efflux system protein